MIHRKLLFNGLWRQQCAHAFVRARDSPLRRLETAATRVSTARRKYLAREQGEPVIRYINENKPPGGVGSREDAAYRQSTVHGIERPRRNEDSQEITKASNADSTPSTHEDLDLDPPAKDVQRGGRTVTISELYNTLRLYAARGSQEGVELIAAHLIKERREAPNMKLYSAMILCNINPEKGSAERVKLLFQELEEDGLVPDSTLYHDALKVLAIHPDCIFRGHLLEEMRQRWITLTSNGWHDVVSGNIREGQLEQALNGIDEMRQAGVNIQGWLSDMMTYALCDVEELDEALRLMQDRVIIGETISSSAWYYLFDVACRLLHHESLRFVWQIRVGTQYLNPSSGQCLQVLNAASQQGNVQLATDVFKLLSDRGVTFEPLHYEMLLESYVHAGDIYTALTILCIMRKAKVVPDERTTRSLTKYLEQSSELVESAFSALQDLDDQGRDIPTAAFNSVLEACVETLGLEAALEQYKTLHLLRSDGANTNTFNMLLRGCRNERRKDTAMFLAAEMLALKIKPDSLTYDRLVLICLQEDDYEDAFKYYDEMRGLGMVPRNGTLHTMVKKCGETGDGRAWEVLDYMKDLELHDAKLRQWLLDCGRVGDGPSMKKRIAGYA